MTAKKSVTSSIMHGICRNVKPGEGGKEIKPFSAVTGWFYLICLCLVCGFYPARVSAQAGQNEAEWSGNGYSIKKVVSNLSIPSGVNFSYTIIFSAPAGVSSIAIQDQVPLNLDIVNVTAAGPVLGVNPVIVWNNVTKLVTYNLSSLPGTGPPSGSFTIVVKFREGVTCNGETARNRAGIQVNGDWQWTPFVSTTATAVDPWIVTKSIISGVVVDPNGGGCGYLMKPGDTITYRLAVMKANGYWGNVTGQQNAGSAQVKDILPAGAYMLPNPNATFSSNTITWNVNAPTQLLDAANPWAYYWIDVKVVYPASSFPVNTQILNSATLTGTSCNQPISHVSNQTCIKVANITPNPNAFFGKYLAMTNRVPGCSGYYYIVFCNNGNVPLSAFNINDAIPAGITVNQVQIYNASTTTTMNLNINNSPFATGINSGSYSSGTLTSVVSNLQFQMTGSMPVGTCLYLYVYFTVNPAPTGTVVNNCATFTPLSNSLSLNPACVQFTIDAGAPNPCLLKDICSPKSSYNPGDMVRFRLRVQNIGSASITGATIQDLLHSNFTYVGNETYYQSSSFSPPCSASGIPPAGASAWPGVTPSHSGNNLSWNLPSIASNCQLFYTSACGYYGTYGLPYYYIEFDAKVDSFALPGVTPNFYKITGGNLPATVTSNTVNVLVVATFGQEVNKFLSTDNGVNYASSGVTAPGSTARYRLNYKNVSNVGVTSVRLIDLLPRDAGTNDSLIFNRGTSRGSQFDVSYIGNHGTSLFPVAAAPVPALSWASGQNICLPPYVVAFGCTSTTWGSTPTKNVRMDFGTFVLGPNKNLREDFDVGIPATAKTGQKVCNDFAAIASASFLLNGSPQVVALTPVAASPVCLTVGNAQGNCCDSVKVTRAPGANGVIGCCAQLTTTCKVKSVDVTVTNGVLSSTSWNCTTPVPGGYVNQSSYTFAPGGCVLSMVNCVTPKQSGVVVISYTITFDNGQKCEKKIELDCAVTQPSCCDSVKVVKVSSADGTTGCCAKLTAKCEVKSIDVTVSNGTLSSVSWNCTTPVPSGYSGQSSFTFAPGSCIPEMTVCVKPASPGIVILTYDIVFANGEKCHKVLDLDCAVTQPSCCDSVRVTRAPGANGVIGCCAQLTTTCKVKSVDVTVTNGVLSSTSWNCTTPVPGGYVNQSSYTFAPGGCVLSMVNCVTPKQSGMVVISYTITFDNGQKCEKKIELDCAVTQPSCCDSVKVETISNPAVSQCCAKLTTTCKVKGVDVTITNGTFVSTAWNCSTPVPSGYVGQSTFFFATNGCVLEMKNCVNPKQTGVVTITYTVYFENGEQCKKEVRLDCNASAVNCCDSVRVVPVAGANGVKACCARITTTCKVKAVDVSVTNGTLSSVNWNCGPLPAGYAGTSSFTFAPNGCVVDMTTCVTPKQSGSVVILYTIYFENGEKCKKEIRLDCNVLSCCEKTTLQAVDGDGCCARLISECPVKKVDVNVTNGFINAASWNCGPLPAGYAGQSSFSFAPANCNPDMSICVKPMKTGTVVITYTITFANGEKCEKSIKLDCKVYSSCCAKADFKLKTKWPSLKNQTGLFQVTNLDPTVPICYIDILPSPAGSFTTGSLSVNGLPSLQPWNPTRIPATGNLTPATVNTVDFNLISTGYQGTVRICVVKCDGTRCCFDFNWNNSAVTGSAVDITKDLNTSGIYAISISPVIKSPVAGFVKYISFGLTDEAEIADTTAGFWAISASPQTGDAYPLKLASTVQSYMGRSQAFFELSTPKSINEKLGLFNLAFSKKLPKLGCALYDENGNILFSGSINVSRPDTVTSALTIEAADMRGNMFEFINLYPNPSDGTFRVTYATGNPRDVEIRVITATGQVVYTNLNKSKMAGIHNVDVNAGLLSSGLYKVVLLSEGTVSSKSLVIR